MLTAFEGFNYMKPVLSNKAFIDFFVFNAVNDTFLSKLINSENNATTQAEAMTKDQVLQAEDNVTAKTVGETNNNNLNYEADNEKGMIIAFKSFVLKIP